MIQSQFDLGSDYGRGLVLDFMTETAEHILPDHEPNEKFFRLILTALARLRAEGDIWETLTYFSQWAVRLAGIFPEVRLQTESVEIAEEMLVTPLSSLTPREWSKGTA